jgi:hypothetical protein
VDFEASTMIRIDANKKPEIMSNINPEEKNYARELSGLG